MGKNYFIGYLSDITPLSVPLKEKLYQLLTEEHYVAHQVIFASGQQEGKLCFIEQGFARSYYYDANGQVHTVKFWGPSDILLSYQGYWNQPAYYYTEVLEETTLITLKYDDLRVLLSGFPETINLTKIILERYHQNEDKKQKLTILSAHQRFLEMKKQNRIVFQKAPLKVIASYLNMSRETLSRMIAKN